jgi:hypothetical protein
LRRYPVAVNGALATVGKLNPEFVDNAIAGLAIRDAYRSVVASAIPRTKAILGAAVRR